MNKPTASQPVGSAPQVVGIERRRTSFDSQTFPFWLVIMVGIIGFMVVQILVNDDYQEAFREIIPGLWLTLQLTAASFVASLFLGLGIGLARISKNPVLSTLAQVYIEFVRGVPMLVFIFVIAFVLTPDVVDLINWAVSGDYRTRDIAPNALRGAVVVLRRLHR